MPDVPEPHLRLSIWRPASLDRTYLLHAEDDGSGSDGYSLFDETDLLEQIYTWDSGEYDLFGSCSSAVTDLIRNRLLNPFSRPVPPDRRSVRHFQSELSKLLDNPMMRTDTFWSDSPDTMPSGSGKLNLRSNVTRGVLRHFLWVAGVYADVPDASVLFR